MNIPDPLFNFLLKLRGRYGPDPYREYNHRYRCIFIHVPKTGGVSVYKTLFKTKRTHIDLKYFEAYNKQLFGQYFKFAFARNPYDRLVSSYFYVTQVQDHNVSWVKKNLQGINDFKSFVLALENKGFWRKVLEHVVFRPQVNFISNLNGDVELDLIARFENMDVDFANLAKRFGINESLIHNNKSSHKQYLEYYDPELLEIVNRLYKEDFEKLNYPMIHGSVGTI